MRPARHLDGAGVERIVKAALAELPPPGPRYPGPILLGAGVVTARLAEALPADRPLTVITNVAAIGQTLAPRANTTVALLGGRLDPRTGAAVDAWALDELAQVSAEVAFVVPDGISVRRGLTATELAGAAVHAAMIAAARRTVLLVDRSRVGVDHMARFGEIGDVDVVITESDLDDQTTADIAARGPRVVRV